MSEIKLKSTFGLRRSKKKKKRKISNILIGGIGALIGIAFVSQTASVLNRI